jgi:hypothetical protein
VNARRRELAESADVIPVVMRQDDVGDVVVRETETSERFFDGDGVSDGPTTTQRISAGPREGVGTAVDEDDTAVSDDDEEVPTHVDRSSGGTSDQAARGYSIRPRVLDRVELVTLGIDRGRQVEGGALLCRRRASQGQDPEAGSESRSLSPSHPSSLRHWTR